MSELPFIITARRVREILNSLLLVLVDVLDLESFLFHEVEETVVFRPVDRAKDVLLTLFRLDVELEAS